MYLPSHFREERLEVLHDAMRAIAFASLVTHGPEGLIATHLPLAFDPQPAPYGTLYGHVARGNPHWRAFAAGEASLAMFVGPHAYVSPSWYPGKHATGEDVPTWNYIAVHAYGAPRIVEEPARLLDILTRLTDRQEAARDPRWRVSDAPMPYLERQLRGIVGFELPIARLEGKWKLSQNRNAADFEGARAGLAASPIEREREVAAAMAAADLRRDQSR